MGLFDDIHCDYPLPDPAHNELDYQTKDLDCLMERFLITKEGRLVQIGQAMFEEPWDSTDQVDMNYHGTLLFYTNREYPDYTEKMMNYEWIEYLAKFTDGTLVQITGSGHPRDYSREIPSSGEQS